MTNVQAKMYIEQRNNAVIHLLQAMLISSSESVAKDEDKDVVDAVDLVQQDVA